MENSVSRESAQTERATQEFDDTIFTSLVQNAFDFLDRSVQDFEKSPKFSVVHFCAALEMLLKARLMREHWSLIVSKPESANRTKFMQGDFASVSLEQSWDRLRDVAGVYIPTEATRSFQVIAKHRNKLVHFYHAEMNADQEVRAQIVSEQGRAWFHLHKLLTTWTQFSTYSDAIERAERNLRTHRKYLKAKFDELASDLTRLKSVGYSLCTCPACMLNAATSEPGDTGLKTWDCMVCEHEFITVKTTCPHCGEETEIADNRRCPLCDEDISAEELASELEDEADAYLAAKGRVDATPLGNCSFCDGYHTVVHCDGRYLCTECFSVTDDVEYCGWCGEPNNGDMNETNYTGCNHCDGYSGHIRERED